MAVRETLGLWTPCTGASRFRGDCLTESQGRLLFNFLLFCFFFSTHLLSPTSLVSSILFSVSIPHYLPHGLEMFHEERIQSHSWLWMQGDLSPRSVSLYFAKGAHGGWVSTAPQCGTLTTSP